MRQSNSLKTPTNLWDKRQLADFLDVSVQTVDQWVSKGTGGPPYIKVGRLVRFRPEDVYAYIARNARFGREEITGQPEFARQQRLNDVLVVDRGRELGFDPAMVAEAEARLMAWLTTEKA